MVEQPLNIQFRFNGPNQLTLSHWLIAIPFQALQGPFGLVSTSAAAIPGPKSDEGSGAKLKYLLIGPVLRGGACGAVSKVRSVG